MSRQPWDSWKHIVFKKKFHLKNCNVYKKKYQWTTFSSKLFFSLKYWWNKPKFNRLVWYFILTTKYFIMKAGALLSHIISWFHNMKAFKKIKVCDKLQEVSNLEKMEVNPASATPAQEGLMWQPGNVKNHQMILLRNIINGKKK